jgi:hypothetical protein
MTFLSHGFLLTDQGKVALPHPVYAWVYRSAFRFNNCNLGCENQINYLEITTQRGKRMLKRDM